MCAAVLEVQVNTYSADKLNDLPRERWDQSRTFIDVPIDVVSDFIPVARKATLNFKVHMGSPSLQFN